MADTQAQTETAVAARQRKTLPGAVIQSLVRGGVFFSWFLPSFSNIGYRLRSPLFRATAFDFSGQHWLVTGASAGIGREIARQAALGGATVLAAARNQPLLDQLAEEVAAAVEPGPAAGRVVPLAADLSEVSVADRALSAAALPLPPGIRLDVLVNNVGVMRDQPEVTAEGLDLVLATNLVVPYQLTGKLLAGGRLDASSTVITMSSGGMYNVPLNLSALLPGKRYNGTLAYAFQKRAQVALNRHWQVAPEYPFASYVMHPGWVDTPGVRSSMPEFYQLMKPILRGLTAGADTALWLAATKPARDRTGGIWLDRKRRPEHLLPGTRGGASGPELIEFLEQQIAQAQRGTEPVAGSDSADRAQGATTDAKAPAG
ncbi:MAG: SDR family NAD(P)-dependent oxidoreductase [Pseudomonadota bacterium]